MKNKINLLIALATLVVVSVSCSDNFLEEKNNTEKTRILFTKVQIKLNGM